MFFHTISSINVFDVTAGAEELSGDIIIDGKRKISGDSVGAGEIRITNIDNFSTTLF